MRAGIHKGSNLPVFLEMKEGFDASQIRLRPLHSEVWEGFIYVSLADKPSTKLAQVLAPFKDQVVGRFDMGEFCRRFVRYDEK